MKCLPQCGWQEMPNNLVHLKRHLQACVQNGPWSEKESDPVVVWRDGAFETVIEAEEGERTFSVGPFNKRKPEVPYVVPYPGAHPLDVEPINEIMGVHLAPEDTPRNEKRIVAEIEDPSEEPHLIQTKAKPRRKKVN